jgi:hypothetical protein
MTAFPPETGERKGITGIGVAELKAMPPEELFRHLEPLIWKWSRSFIPGFDQDDRRQEILVVIWRCQMRYDPEGKRGFGDRPSSFLNFVIHSIKMRLGNCKYTGERQQYATASLECWGCGLVIPVFSQAKSCPACGGSRWKTLRDVRIASVEKLSEYSDAWQPGLHDEYHFEMDEVIESIVSKVPTRRRGQILTGLKNGKLSPKMRAEVQSILRLDPGILPTGASSPVFRLRA